MRRLSGILLVFLVLSAWEASARFALVSSASWPSLSSTLLEIVTGFQSGELLRPWWDTFTHTIVGFAIGSVLGVFLGVICGRSPIMLAIINPIVETLRPIPTPAIIPPLILLLGIDDALKETVISIAVFFPVFTNTVGGVRMTSDVLFDTARTFQVGALRSGLFVILPAALPAIMSGLRIAIGLALVVTVVAEMTAGSSGFGYYIVQMQFAMRPQAMYAAIIILAATGYALNAISLRVERRVLFWQT